MSNQTSSEKDDTATKREHWLAVYLVSVGLIFLVVSVWQLWMTLIQLQITFSLELILAGFVWFTILSFSIAMALYPVRNRKVFRALVQIALWPLEILAIVGYFSTFVTAPFLTLIVIVIFPVLVWFTVQRIGLIPPVTEQASLYVILVIVSLGFAYWGEKITRFIILNWLQREEDFSSLFGLVHPRIVRVYTYAIMAVAYMIANFEKFSGLTITTALWWMSYKEVLVEVLLTYVAIDSALIIWKDYKAQQGNNTG